MSIRKVAAPMPPRAGIAWLFGGLHRIDFTAWMRARPAWDIIMLTLMFGGLALTTTGFYLA
jgi:hypothetical protein